jgi:hypothetical protein
LIKGIESQLYLYEVYKKTYKNPDKLDQFLNYGHQILNDFNTIDRYLLDTKHLIFDLKSITEIDTWSLNSKELTLNQEKFITYFKNLGNLYLNFQKELSTHNRATNGMIYKSIACNCDLNFNPLSDIYFIGLNALSTAEEEIIKHLVEQKKARVFFDGDKFYTENKNHEAGYFYRKYLFNQTSNISEKITKSTKNFNFYEAKSSQEQTSFVNSILNELPLKNRTVIYLMDENMAGPLQQHVKSNHAINFTMGLPINKSEVYILIAQLLDSLSFKNREKYFLNDSIHFEFISKIISLKTLKKKIGIDFISSKKWKDTIDDNKLFLKRKWISQNLEEINSFFEIWTLVKSENGVKLLNHLKHYIEKIKYLFKKDDLEIYVLKQFNELIDHLLTLTENHEVSKQVIIKLLLQECKKFTLPSSGDPFNGVQVMGFLESRILDFENAIYLSCNENFLPKADANQSFLPNDLKQHYGLPGTYEKDALYSYYFYRSLQHVKNAHFVHIQSKSSGLNSSERSRFIDQVNLDLKPFKNITFKNFITKPWTDRNQFLKKENKILNNDLIERWVSSGISPSSINCFSKCSLDFYNKYLLRIAEEKTIENRISPSKWGDIIHLVLEDLFYEGLVVNKATLNTILKTYKALMKNKFEIFFSDQRHLKGQNGLVYRQFEQCIMRLIKNELNEVNTIGEFKVLYTEKTLFHELLIPFNGKNITAKLKGKADRIDQTSSGLRIIDYKTGYFQAKDVKVENYNVLFEKEKALQLVFYAYLYLKEFQQVKSISSGVISIKNPKSNKLMFSQGKNNLISSEITEIFESKLIDLVGSMNNNGFIFEHDSNSKYCMMC